MTPLLEARGLDYSYARGLRVVRDVSLCSMAGAMTAVIGANGSGKSTLIRMLAGLLHPQAGTISLDGVSLDEWEPRLRARQIAYVPQSTAAAFPFPAIDIVLSGRMPYARSFRFESPRDVGIAMEALKNAGAAHLATRAFTSLSGGERQAVILARALAQEPRMLLLDEPSSSFDLKHRTDLLRTLLRLRATRGLSVIMITHDLALTDSFDQLVALREGKVAAAGRPDEVLRDDLLRDIYGERKVRTQRTGDRTMVWVDL